MIDLKLEVEEDVWKTFGIPQSWSDVTVGQFIKQQSMVTEGKNDLEVLIELLSILSGMTMEESESMPDTIFMELINTFKFLSKPVDAELAESIKIGEDEYFIKKDFNSLNLAEIINVDVIMNEYKNNLTEAMPKLLCIFLRKKNKKGNLEKMKTIHMDRKDIFKDISIQDVHNLFFCFSGGKSLSSVDMNHYLENLTKEKKTMTKNQNQDSKT